MSGNIDKKKVPSQAHSPGARRKNGQNTTTAHASAAPASRRKSSKATQSASSKGPSTGLEAPSKDIYFLIPRTCTILYGPYQWQGIMDYRTERLQGLKTFLEKLGVTVTLTPCLDHVNLARIWFLDELIWSCKITDLNGGELDPLCWEAADKLEGMVKRVLKGLRGLDKGLPTVGQLKEPFCPCFQVDWGKGVKGMGGKRLGSLGQGGKGPEAVKGEKGGDGGKCLACSAIGGAGGGGGAK